MSDRELLELAALAAGIKAYAMPGASSCLWLESSMVNTMPTAWRPLTDDGDALRLAVKLNMRLDILDFAGWSLAATRNNPLEVDWAEEHHAVQGAEAATRRAIVRAAAAMHRPTAQETGEL